MPNPKSKDIPSAFIYDNEKQYILTFEEDIICHFDLKNDWNTIDYQNSWSMYGIIIVADPV